MSVVDLPAVEFPLLSPRLRAVEMVDGPCAGRWEMVPGNAAENWVLVGKDRTKVDGQMHACYRPDPIDGTWRYSGITVDTDTLYAAIAAAKADGIHYGESYGA